MQQWENWQVWESPVFILTLVLLTVSIICGGMINRWSGIAQRVWRPGIRTSIGFFRAVKTATTLEPSSPEDGVSAFTTTLGAHRYRVRSLVDTKTGATHLYADKNRYSLLATFPFHAGLVLLMVGAMIAAAFGWREIGFLVPDGSTRAVGHGTGLSIKNDAFIDSYYDDGRAKDYYSDVESSRMARSSRAAASVSTARSVTTASRSIRRPTVRRPSSSSPMPRPASDLE